MLQRETEISAHIVAFSRYLRLKGFMISPMRESDALLALTHIEPTKQNFYLALRCIFPQNFKNLRDFDAIFDKYWKELEKGVDAKIAMAEEESAKKKKKPVEKKQTAPAFESLKNWLYGNKEKEEELAAYSDGISLEKKDFSAFTDDDLAEAEKLIKLIARRLAQKPSRRFEPTRHGGILDLRRTLQKNFRNGEEILFLHHKKAKPTRVKLFLICDVSKSMEIYSRFFVQFMYAFKKVYHRIETYVFSTSLQRISDELNESDFRTALQKVSDTVPHWAGGTDIGQSLWSFAENDCQRLLDRKSIVLIISDGLDMGEPEIVEESLKAIKKRANKIVWLNPLAGHAGYKPEARSMKAALPLLDVFSSGHNFETLKEVILKLKV